MTLALERMHLRWGPHVAPPGRCGLQFRDLTACESAVIVAVRVSL